MSLVKRTPDYHLSIHTPVSTIGINPVEDCRLSSVTAPQKSPRQDLFDSESIETFDECREHLRLR